MTEERLKKMESMITEIYHHLGLDGKRPLSMTHLQDEAAKNVLKWKIKKTKKDHECATNRQK